MCVASVIAIDFANLFAVIKGSSMWLKMPNNLIACPVVLKLTCSNCRLARPSDHRGLSWVVVWGVTGVINDLRLNDICKTTFILIDDRWA